MARVLSPNDRPRSIADVNRALEQAGKPERLARGRDYLYFTGGNAQQWNEAGVYGVGPVVSALTIGQWLAERDSRQEEWERSR